MQRFHLGINISSQRVFIRAITVENGAAIISEHYKQYKTRNVLKVQYHFIYL